MRPYRIILLLGFALILLYQHYCGGNSTPDSSSRQAWAAQPRVQAPAENPAANEIETNGAVPKKAYQVLEIIRKTGAAPEGYVGGRTFQNREHRLPANGNYREFDVDPHHGQRNAERIIVEWDTKKAWYTNDHYRTFIPLP